MAATGQAERKIGFGPQPPGYIKVGTPYPYRSRGAEQQHGLGFGAALDETIRMEGAETVAAFICEPITSGEVSWCRRGLEKGSAKYVMNMVCY